MCYQSGLSDVTCLNKIKIDEKQYLREKSSIQMHKLICIQQSMLQQTSTRSQTSHVVMNLTNHMDNSSMYIWPSTDTYVLI